jgi:hypothetical protein
MMKRVSWLVMSFLWVGLMVKQVAAQEVRVKIRLRGPAIGGVVPQGSSEYRARGKQGQFKAQAIRVNLADGTVLSVQVNGNDVGNITLVGGAGSLELSTNDGDTVPNIQPGDVVSLVTSNGATILSGQF